MLEIALILETVFFLVVLTERLTEAIVAPIKNRWPHLDMWWLVYVSWVVGGVLVFLADVNLFVSIFPSYIVGKVLSAIIAGGGANLLHDVFDKR